MSATATMKSIKSSEGQASSSGHRRKAWGTIGVVQDKLRNKDDTGDEDLAG